MTEQTQAFKPNWISPPGHTVLDLMEDRGWTQVGTAKRLGLSTKHLNQLIKGKVPLTDETALRLTHVFGGKVGFWLRHEAHYRELLSMRQTQARYEKWTAWLDKLPLADLKKAGVIPPQRITKAAKPALVECLLRFFSVASPDEWQKCYGDMPVLFRREQESRSDLGATASWLRLGEVKAEELETPKYDKADFKSALRQIRELTVLPPKEYWPKLHSLCTEAGVRLVRVPAIPKARVSGVARWLNKRPLIQLSLFGKTNDRLWFTFFHEAAHILLHADEKTEIFLDDDLKITSQSSNQEDEANRWARDILIPPAYQHELKSLRTEQQIQAFARKINIHPGIVVGRLQHDRLLGYQTTHNRLKAGTND